MYEDRTYVLVHLTSITFAMFQEAVAGAIQTDYTTCFYSIDPIDGISRYALLKYDGADTLKLGVASKTFSGDRSGFLDAKTRQYKAYIPRGSGHLYQIEFSDQTVTLDRRGVI